MTMPKKKIEIEVDIPEGYEATGEYRIPDEPNDYWLGDFGMASGPSSCHRIIFRKLPDPIPEVEGPRGWPELRWAAKLRTGTWFLCSQEPRKTAAAYVGSGTSILAHNLPWTPPSEIADLPPEKSLVKLTHECLWVEEHEKKRVWTSCGTFCDIGFKFNFCPNCGRNLVMVGTSTA